MGKPALTYRLQGTALFYALLITTLVGILLTALLSLWIYFRTAHQRDLNHWQLLENIESGWKLLWQVDDPLPATRIDLYHNTTDSVQVIRQTWGAYELIGSQATAPRQSSYAKIGLVGYRDELGAVLVLPDGRKPLVLAGRSQIIGDAIIPRGGIRTAVVNQRAYEMSQTVIGSVQSGAGTPPLIDEEAIAAMEAPVAAQLIGLADLPDSLDLSYFENPILIQGKHVVLRKRQWSGPIYVQADSLIEVRANAHLQGLILDAPEIIISRGFQGQLQLYAGARVSIEPDVQLTYPSIVSVRFRQARDRPLSPRLEIGPGSLIEGFVLGIKLDDSAVFPVLFAEKAQVTGRIVWQGPVTASGLVEGSIYCRNFELRSDRGENNYNYILDFRIDGPARSSSWVEPLFWNQGQKAVAKWLD